MPTKPLTGRTLLGSTALIGGTALGLTTYPASTLAKPPTALTPEEIIVIAPDGKVARTIAVSGSDVNNVKFGGKDYKTIYITEAKTGALYTTEIAIGGLPLFRAPQNEAQ